MLSLVWLRLCCHLHYSFAVVRIFLHELFHALVLLGLYSKQLKCLTFRPLSESYDVNTLLKLEKLTNASLVQKMEVKVQELTGRTAIYRFDSEFDTIEMLKLKISEQVYDESTSDTKTF